jgi:DNA-binding NarL/FixJ family response regulator
MTTVLIAVEEPLVQIGIRVTIEESPDFEAAGIVSEGTEVPAAVADLQPDILLLDSHFQQRDDRLVPQITGDHPECKLLVLVDHTDDACTLRYLLSVQGEHRPTEDALKAMKECCLLALRQSARGCLPKQSGPDRLLTALRAVAAGEVWVGPALAEHWLDWWRDKSPRGSGSDHRLTVREIEVIGLVVDGLSNREIGKSLGVQEQTVKNHVARIMDKLNVRNRVELALKAVRDNIA